MNPYALIAAFLPLLVFSCKRTEVTPQIPQQEEKIPINIATTITRATDFGFQSGDVVGLYVVNQPAELALSGNHADNVPFTFTGSSWSSTTKLYWKDDSTPADFYCYYPYKENVTSVTAYPVNVSEDQSSDDNYAASDFLWGKTENVSPTPDPVQITVRHLASRLKVVLKAGTGWTDDDIAAASVTLAGLKTEGSASLADGVLSAQGEQKVVTPHNEGAGVFKALVLPQSIENSPLVRISIGDRQYVLDTTITFVSGKEHTCTVTIKRTSEGINVGIGAWDTDDIDYGGTVE